MADQKGVTTIDPTRYEVLTFDCYGTLIDWETSILGALEPVLSAHRIELSRPEILKLYAEVEAKVEAGPYLKYRAVLSRVVRKIGDTLGFVPSKIEETCLADSIGTWPPFPDSVETLRSLKDRFKLGVISNIDRDLFNRSASLLETEFDWVITAEDAQSYKPSHNNFNFAINTIGVPIERVLHVAESLRHDIVPAKELGLSAVWVNRGKSRGRAATASGNVESMTVEADAEVPDLRTLADLLAPASG